MRWFRTNRFSAWLALFALTVQFALSFGHLHVPGSAKGMPSLLSLAIAQSSTDAPNDPAKPAKPVKQIAHDQCAICASIELAGSLIPAAAPSLLLPADLSNSRLGTSTDVAIAASPSLSFQARAPPQA
jgi:Protein of unknown function (DUF2946)